MNSFLIHPTTAKVEHQAAVLQLAAGATETGQLARTGCRHHAEEGWPLPELLANSFLWSSVSACRLMGIAVWLDGDRHQSRSRRAARRFGVSQVRKSPQARRHSDRFQSGSGVTRPIAEGYRALWERLGIPESLIAARNLPIFELATELQLAEASPSGVEHFLTPVAAAAWRELKAAARRDAVDIYIVSAFRSVERQVELVARKLAAGQSLYDTLRVLAPPGCSEHHTGRAVDLGSGRFRPLQPDFDACPAFAWLSAHAVRFGFSLSFPRDNAFGFIYEPWHWCFSEAGGS